MTPANQKDINLLPKELAQKKAVHREASGLLVEYTDVANRGATGADPGKQKIPGFFSRLFSLFKRKEKPKKPTLVLTPVLTPAKQAAPAQKAAAKPPPAEKERRLDLPQGKALPSALFAGAAKKPAPHAQASAAPVPFREPGVAAEQVMSMHTPDFLDSPELSHAVAPQPAFSPLPQAAPAKQKQEPRPAPVLPPVLTTAAVVAKKTGASEQTQAPVHRLSGFDVNLLAAEYTQAFAKGNPLVMLLSWTAVAVLVLGVAYGLLELYQVRGSRRLAQEERVVRALKETIATYQDLSQEDSVLYRKVAAGRELLGNHLSWHAFLGKLEEVTIPEITYISMAASTEGIMNLTAFAGDYTGLARQIVVFQQTAWIKDIMVTSASRVEESPTQAAGVSFDISLDISPDALEGDTRYE